MTRRQRYFVKQKLMGLGMIALGVISAVVFDGDVTACVIFSGLGLALICSKELYYED